MKITRSDDGSVTVVLAADEAQNLEDHLLWDDYATDGTAAGQLWGGLVNLREEPIDSSQATP